eukprot:Rmarinus@m.20173
MKLKELEGFLQTVTPFQNPKVMLEQYPTSPHIASRMLYAIDATFDDLDGKIVGDLGCGCGVLAIGANLLGSCYTVGFDVDTDALAQAHENNTDCEAEVDFVRCDIPSYFDGENGFPRKFFDTIVMNPPFGTRKKGVDMEFLKVAFQLARGSVYSLHKTSTRNHILKTASSWGAKCEVVAELRFDIPNMYKHHKKRTQDVQVDFLRFDLSQVSSPSESDGGV